MLVDTSLQRPARRIELFLLDLRQGILEQPVTTAKVPTRADHFGQISLGLRAVSCRFMRRCHMYSVRHPSWPT